MSSGMEGFKSVFSMDSFVWIMSDHWHSSTVLVTLAFTQHSFLLNPANFYACPKPGPRFSTPYVMVFFMFNYCLVVFFHIGGIFYHHCLNFLFITSYAILLQIFNIIYGVDVVEWSRALDVRLSEWCCSVTMVWVQIPSREEQKFDSSKI